ncbi:hypothetical protein VNO78_23725 [Psophocarpus tetragonolobus]|uniref:Uncharacterized protein n=1 Tax=Psophocarpus tetragonolobus TaxID=3891 RepID=A0AAN9S458_PSOTE
MQCMNGTMHTFPLLGSFFHAFLLRIISQIVITKLLSISWYCWRNPSSNAHDLIAMILVTLQSRPYPVDLILVKRGL